MSTLQSQALKALTDDTHEDAHHKLLSKYKKV